MADDADQPQKLRSLPEGDNGIRETARREAAMPQTEAIHSSDLVSTTFQLLALGTLIALSFWIIRPFLVAILWAITLAIATWPFLLRMQSWLGGRRNLAAAAMTASLLVILGIPLYFAVTAIVDNAGEVTNWSRSLAAVTRHQPPSWISGIPMVGAKLAARWRQLAASGPDEVAAHLAPFASTLARWFLRQVGNLGLLLAQFAVTLIILAILYAHGEEAADSTIAFVRRLAGLQGEKAVRLAARAVRGVALGIIVTAVLQSVLAGLGLLVAGVPFVMILMAIMFMLTVAQIGPWPVLIGALFWIDANSGGAWTVGFAVWAVFCVTVDNLLRPMLIKRGVDIPLILIFAGVIGGLIAFGLIGLFVGPIVLAVAHVLLLDWMLGGEIAARNSTP